MWMSHQFHVDESSDPYVGACVITSAAYTLVSRRLPSLSQGCLDNIGVLLIGFKHLPYTPPPRPSFLHSSFPSSPSSSSFSSSSSSSSVPPLPPLSPLLLFLHVCTGTPPGKPDTPPLFLWKDLPSGTDIVTTWETAYGSAATVFVLPNGVALAAAWNGDNTGKCCSFITFFLLFL